MECKKGFISTGLIYSFFLIFLTLFLTTITNYLYKKRDLSILEDSIKIGLNVNMYVDDFQPGDLITFVSDSNGDGSATCEDVDGFVPDNSYLVVDTITYDDGTFCGSGNNACLILYSYKLFADETGAVTFQNIKDDIGTSIVFDHYRYNILYKYDGYLTNQSYKLKDSNYFIHTFSAIDSSYGCVTNSVKDEIYCSRNPLGIIGGITNSGDAKYRKRVIKPLTNNRVENCNIKDDIMGAIYVKE